MAFVSFCLPQGPGTIAEKGVRGQEDMSKTVSSGHGRTSAFVNSEELRMPAMPAHEPTSQHSSMVAIGRGSPACTANWSVIDRWWPVGEECSVFFTGVAPGRVTMPPLDGPTPIFGLHGTHMNVTYTYTHINKKKLKINILNIQKICVWWLSAVIPVLRKEVQECCHEIAWATEWEFISKKKNSRRSKIRHSNSFL